MSLSLKVKRGFTVVDGVPFSNADLNAGFLPIITLEGTIGTTDLDPGVIHKEQVTPDAYWYADDSDAGANVLVATYDPAPDALEDGLLLAVKVQTANSGAVTFNPNGLGAKPLLKYHDQPMAAGDLEDNQIIEMRYDAEGDGGNGAWQLLTPVASAVDKNNAASLDIPVGKTLDNTGTPYGLPGSGLALTIAHGLGAIPQIVRAVLVCTATDLGWAEGDEVDIFSATADLQGSGTYEDNDMAAFTVGADATNITIAEAQYSQGIQLCNKTGGVMGNAITPAKWGIRVYALKF